VPRRWSVAVTVITEVYGPDLESAAWSAQQAVRAAVEPEVAFSPRERVVVVVPVTAVFAYEAEELGPERGGEPVGGPFDDVVG
jgi:hypothetical protein